MYIKTYCYILHTFYDNQYVQVVGLQRSQTSDARSFDTVARIRCTICTLQTKYELNVYTCVHVLLCNTLCGTSFNCYVSVFHYSSRMEWRFHNRKLTRKNRNENKNNIILCIIQYIFLHVSIPISIQYFSQRITVHLYVNWSRFPRYTTAYYNNI